MDISINYWAVLVAGVSTVVTGSLWYGPIFGKTWIAMMGWTKEQMEQGKKGMVRAYVIQLVGSMVTAYVLAQFVAIWGVVDITGAFQLAFWAWLGFIATVMLGSILWEGKPVKLYLLNTGYWLVNLFIMSVILTLWI